MTKDIALLLLVPAEMTETECGALQRIVAHLTSALKTINVSTVALSFTAASVGNRRGCSSPGTYFIVDPERWIVPDVPARGSRTLALMVGEGLTIRQIFRADKAPPAPESVADQVKLWRDGSAIFKAQRAHAMEMMVKTKATQARSPCLVIGNRHSEEEIFELTQRAGFVDLSSLNDRARRALSLFVSGL